MFSYTSVGNVTQITEPPTTIASQQTFPCTTQSSPTTTKHIVPTHHSNANTDSSTGGQHGPGVAVIAGVSVSVVVLVVLAVAVITAIVVYLAWKKQAPQSKGFSKLSMTSMENNAVAV